MRRPQTVLLLLFCLLAGFRPAAADTNYMILEIYGNDTSSHQALDQSLAVDGLDPVLQHIYLNRPTNPATAQVLWVASDEPARWVRGFDTNEFLFVEFAQLPNGSQIEYRIYDNQTGVELSARRHHRTSEDWGISYNMINRLQVGEYRIEARVIVPERRMHRLVQRLNVVNYDGSNAPGQIIEDDSNNDAPPPSNPDADPVEDPVDPALLGFTPLAAASDTRIIYVSSSDGDDDNDGLTPQTPVETLDRGASLLRNGRPDWLLLKAGDTWVNESFDGFTKSGAGADRPMVIGVYGLGARPIIIPRHNQHGLRTVNDEVNGLIIQGLNFYAATRDPGSPRYVDRLGETDGINVRIGGSEDKFVDGLVIEDCIITHFDSNIKIVDDRARQQGPGEPGRIQATIRRNIIRFASGGDSHSIGIYVEGTHDTVIEQNLIDHNGWAQTDDASARNKRSHNIYAQSFNGPITVRDNIISRGAAHGLQLRAGGHIDNNLFVRNALAFWTSINDSTANYNVILESEDMNPEVPEDWRGHGLNGWGMNRYEVIGNVIAQRAGTLQKPGIEVSADTLIVRDNRIYDWANQHTGRSIIYSSSNASVSGNVTSEQYDGLEPPFIDPTRNVDTYAGTIGLEPTLEAFLNAAASRPRGVWIEDFMPSSVCDYIREGFELVD